MKKHLKTNPNRIPRTEADVQKALDRGRGEGLSLAIYIFLYTLAKYHGMDKEKIQAIGNDCNYVADLVNTGRAKFPDLVKIVNEEYDFTWEE